MCNKIKYSTSAIAQADAVYIQMMAVSEIVFEVKLAWWFKYFYRPMWVFVVNFIIGYIDVNFEPDTEKLSEVVYRAMAINRIKDNSYEKN